MSIARLTLQGGNPSGVAGGAIRVADTSTLTLTLVRVRDTAAGSGAAIYVLAGAHLNIYSSRIENNLGGGLYLQVSTTTVIRDSTISGNHAQSAAGILSSGILVMVNSTVSGNVADTTGGGLTNGGVASLYNVTVADNTAGANGINGNGGGIANTLGSLTLRNSIVANNADLSAPSYPDCVGTLTSAANNLIENLFGCTTPAIPVAT